MNLLKIEYDRQANEIKKYREESKVIREYLSYIYLLIYFKIKREKNSSMKFDYNMQKKFNDILIYFTHFVFSINNPLNLSLILLFTMSAYTIQY